MEGRRFGAGAVAGLLFALGIVAAAGLLAAPASGPATFSPASTTSNVETVAPGTQAAVSANGSAPSSSSTGGLNGGFGVAANGQNHASGFSSLASIGGLSTGSRVLLMAPIAAAVLLGGLLFWASKRRQAG